jgi:hypothetical protein
MNPSEILDARVKGQLPISVATSLAIEGLLGILEDKPADPDNPLRRYAQTAVNAYNTARQFLGIHVDDTPVDVIKAPIKDYDELWINVRTLFRNIVGALSNEDAAKIEPDAYAMLAIEELNIIKAALLDHGFEVVVVGYVCSYASLSGNYPKAQMREIRTDKQLFYAALENQTVAAAFENLGRDNELLLPFDVSIRGNSRRTMLLSNYPIDLINFKSALQLALVESHTGVIKKRQHWHTKLLNGRDLPHIPFDRMTIQMFGDTGNLFAPYPKAHREKLLALATQYQWTSLTTKSRILQCAELARDPTFEAVVRAMYF